MNTARQKAVITILTLIGVAASTPAADIVFTDQTATFTNLQGTLYSNATLVKADLDGLVWRIGASGGRVCYTNLDQEFLARLHIPAERIEIARARAEHKAINDAQYRAWAAKADAEIGRQQRTSQALNVVHDKVSQHGNQMSADAAKIEALKAQIETAQLRVDLADAVTPIGAAGDPAYVAAVEAQRAKVNVAQVQLEAARLQLARLEAEFEKKYSGTNSPEAVSSAAAKETINILSNTVPAQKK